MIEKIIHLDKQLFLFLNNLGSNSYDNIWLFLTKTNSWIPIFILFLLLIFKNYGAKKSLLLIVLVSLLILFTDQTCNFFKYTFERIRPCNNPELQGFMRVVKPSHTFSFFSGHAANSSAISALVFLLLRKHYKWISFIFIWPLVFAYSRIYLGLHFPLDILTGYIFGTLSGYCFYKIFKLLEKRLF